MLELRDQFILELKKTNTRRSGEAGNAYISCRPFVWTYSFSRILFDIERK